MENMADNKLGLNWSAVERALGEGTFSGYKIGVLETEKLFEELLEQKQIPGRNAERKLKYIARFLSLPDKLDYSRNIYERVVHEPHFEISREETKQVIMGYWQAMLDIEEAVQTLTLKEKIMMRLKYYASVVLKNLKIFGLIILGIAILIWFLGETNAGRQTSQVIVNLNHFFIFKFLFWLLIFIGGLVVIGIILYLINMKKRRF